MTALRQSSAVMTEAEYLEFERSSELKHEFLNGDVFAMTGASRIHNLITAKVITALTSQLRGRPCEVYASDMRLKVTATGLYTYPDVSVICGEPQLTDDRLDTITNPIVIVEVLSPSTESYDRGKKFQHYRELPSLREYLLISQDSPRIERYLRKDNGLWEFMDAKGLEASLPLPSIDCALMLADVYDQITFDIDEGQSS
jgi:Uma2 family endonuclease